MQMFRKIGNEVILVYNPRHESVEVGENIKIVDEAAGRGLLVQIIEQSLVDIAGILEDIIRMESIERIRMEEHAPPEYERYRLDVKNMKFARAKIRKEFQVKEGSEEIINWTGWVPDRSAKVEPIDDKWLLEKLRVGAKFYKHPALIGKTLIDRNYFVLSPYHFQGINLIVGKKGTGKSHLAKAMLLPLIRMGAKAIIFDINDEYSPLRFLKDEKTISPFYDKLICLEPGYNMKFTLPYVGLDVFLSVLSSLGISDASPSGYEARVRFEQMFEEGSLSFRSYKSNIEYDSHLRSDVREALVRRLNLLESTNLFTDEKSEAITIEGIFNQLSKGGALIINLKAKSRVVRDIVVQTILSKIQLLRDMAFRGEEGISPLFIFAEEAHMYISETSWDDIITRMRHLGTFQFYMTNTPMSLPILVIRQADNIFLFHLASENDIRHVAPAAKIDEDTIISIARALPERRCLAVGTATNDYPFVIDVKDLPVSTAGKTIRYFEEP